MATVNHIIISLMLTSVLVTLSQGQNFDMEPGVKCSCQLSGVISFTASHYRNSSGQWNTELSMERGVCSADGRASRPYFPGSDLPNSILPPTRPLATDYELFPNVGYYKIHTVTRTWEEARRICMEEGAHLAIINSEAEASVIQELYLRHPNIPNAQWPQFAFLGYHDIFDEGTYITIFGEPLYSLGFDRVWSTGENDPNNIGATDIDPGQDCGSVHRNGGLNDLNCDRRHPFFCEKELGEYPPRGGIDYSASAFYGLETEVKPPNGTVKRTRTGPGYELFEAVGFYKLHTTSTTWENARRICKEEGGHLAILNSIQESEVLMKLFQRTPSIRQVLHNDFAFLGFHDIYVEGQYRTIYDEPLATQGFSRWWAGPDNAGANNIIPGEDCGCMHRNGGLNDVSCDRNLAFFCEQELFI